MTDTGLLVKIQNTFDAAVIEEIFDAYAKSGIEPSVRLVEAIAVLCGKSSNEIRKWFDRSARGMAR